MITHLKNAPSQTRLVVEFLWIGLSKKDTPCWYRFLYILVYDSMMKKLL